MCAQPLARGRPVDPPGSEWLVYCLISGSELEGFRTYVGITKNITRRLDQHNGRLAGGAKSTRSKSAGSTWEILYTVTGFGQDKSSALRFEYAWKHGNSRQRSPENRTANLHELLRDSQWSHLQVQDSVAHVVGAADAGPDM